MLEETLKSNNLLESPILIFISDESGFPLQHKPGQRIEVQGQRGISCITSSDKAQIIVLSTCSASGYLLPSMVIFDQIKLKPNFTTGEIPGTGYVLSKNGWIDSELFQEWLLITSYLTSLHSDPFCYSWMDIFHITNLN